MLKFFNPELTVAGSDEAGRGCLAGPVTAAAVILPASFKNSILNDSKQLSLKNRTDLRKIIEENAVCYAVSHVFMEEIDELNILNASILAMHRAIAQLTNIPEFLIIDGNKFKPYEQIPHECIIKGDSKYMSIAAASILAKTYRDEYMEKIGLEYPHFNWKKNKGYPTREHREAIKEHGSSKYHRKSFKLLPEQLSLQF